MEYIGNRPNPYPDDPTYRWWLDPNWIYGGMNPPPFGPAGAGEPGGGPGGGGGQQAPNEGQVVNQPQDPTGTAQDPVFSTDVWGDRPPLQTIGSNTGELDLNQYLATLPGGGTPGGTGGDYKTYFTGDLDTGGGDTGGGNTNTYFTDPPAEERGNTYTYFSDPSFGDPSKGNYHTYFSDPSVRGDYHTYFAPVPTRPPINGPVITTPPRENPTETFPPIRTQPPPQQQQPPGQQKQQPGVGKLLAALPMLAAFQGGTTTTPAPYAHLGPHTAVAPVFKPQARGNPVPSIGQLLAGVR